MDPLSPWRWLAAETPLRVLRGLEKCSDFQRPQQWQKHGFQRKKAFKRWSGPDAMAERQKEPMRAE
jgi:hypothetical protein